MVRLRKGAAAVAVAVAVGSIALSGCETKTGVAGFVGKTPIETSQLSGLVDRGAQAAEGAQANLSRQEIQQFWLATLVRVYLAERVGAAQGITLSQSDVTVFLNRFAPLAGGLDTLRQQAASRGIAASDLPVLMRDWAYENAIATKIAPNVAVSDSDARQVFQQLQAGYPGQTYEQLAPLIRGLLVFDQQRAAVFPLLQDEARRTKIRINPRFGTWDESQLAIGNPPTDLARAATPSSTPPPLGSDETSDGTPEQPDTVPVAPAP